MQTSAELEVIEKTAQYRLLGIPISIADIGLVTRLASRFAFDLKPRMIFFRDAASLMVARDEPILRNLHEVADLIAPDGMPLVWAGRIQGVGKSIARVSGADLMDALCQYSLETGQSHYFFGGKAGISERLADSLQKRYPGLNIAGHASPPMRSIGPGFEPDAIALAEIQTISDANPDFIWVGLSSPKQEYWIASAVTSLKKGVLLGVGAAFDFQTGAVKRAPLWMQRWGLEWLHRLISEPSRLWKRYLVKGPKFLALVFFEIVGNIIKRTTGKKEKLWR